MTGRAFVLLLIAASTLYAANNVGVGWLYALGYTLALGVGASAAFGWWSLRGLRLEVSPAPRAEAGQSLRMAVMLVNTGRHTRRMIAVMAPPLGQRARLRPWRRTLRPVDWSLVLVPALAPGERLTLPLDVPAPHRGLFAPSDVLLQAAPLGLIAWIKGMGLAQEAHARKIVAIHPRLSPLSAFMEAEERANGERPRGQSPRGEFAKGLRPYRSGDAMKRIHWRTSARMGRLVVKELEGDGHVPMLALRLEAAADKEIQERQLSEAASRLVHAHAQGWRATITSSEGSAPSRQTLEAQLDWLAAWP